MAEAAAAFIIKSFALTGASAVAASAAVTVAVNAALYAGISAITRQNSEQKQQGGLIDLQLNSSAPRQLVIGKRMTGGVLVDWYLAGSNNTKLYLPVYLSEGPCGQITRVFADGRVVWSTPLAHGVRTTIPDFRSGGDRLWLTYYDGRVGQSADATLVGLGQGWTSANKMTGCAWVLIECQWDSDNMRSPPSLSFEMEGAKLYDRRKDGTAGGTGSHRIDDPATWEFSDNPAVALDHFLLGRYWNGARTFGIGLSADEVPYSYFAAQANVCDEDVDLKVGGTQKRYRANGFIFANEDYATTITRLCTAMAARPADFGGRFGVIGVESKTPVLTIDDGDLIAGVQEVYTPKRSWGELVGSVEGRFQDPAQLYQPTPYPTVTDATWEAEDGGEPKLMTLDLEMETNVERAQRLATLKARSERRQATLRGVYPLWTVELERGDWFIRTGAKWGEGGKTFEVLERVLDPATWNVTILAQEVDPADSAWDESTASDGPPAPLSPTDTLSAVQVPSLTVTPVTIAGLAATIPSIKVAWAAVTDPRVTAIFIEVFRDGDDQKVATAYQAIPDDDNQVVIQNGIADDVAYYVRAKFLTPTLSSAWSTEVTTTSDDAYATGSASSVPWSGVADDNGLKPDDNADVTAANTAAAISGQGALATLGQVNFGVSGRVYRDDGSTRITDALAVTSLGTAAAIASQGALATLGQVNLGASGRVYRDDGSTRLTDALAVTSLGTAAAIASQGALATLGQVNLGASGRVYRDDGTTRLTDALAVTSLGVASAIAGQGALATKATIDSSALVGSGVIVYTALASTAVRLGTNITRADGTTSLTDALAVTSLGTAAAIASQGALATQSTLLPSQGTEFDQSNMVQDSNLLDSAYWTVGSGWVFASTDSPEVVTTLAVPRAIRSALGNGTTSQSATATDTGTSVYLNVEPNAPYRVGGKLNNRVGFTGRGRIGINWYDKDKVFISTSYIFGTSYLSVAAGSDVVETISGVLKAPSNALFARFRVLVEWSTTLNNASRCYFANLRMHRASQLGNTMVREDAATLLTDALAVTSLGTAAAISGQGSGATANNLAGLNATDNSNLNAALYSAKRLIVSDFSADARHWTTDFGGSPDTVADPIADGYYDVANIGRVIRITPTRYLQPKGMVKPLQGRRYLVVARLRVQTDPSSGSITASISNVNGLSETYVHGVPTFTQATPVNAINSKSNFVVADGWITLARIFTAGAPSTYDAFVRWRLDLTQSGSGGKVEVAALSAFDVTDIPVGRALTELFRADGSTALTDASVVTSLGTAASITSQGNFATVNFVRQATDPGGSEGKWWVDTTANQLKLYTGGAWQVISDITTAATVAAAVAENVFTKTANVGGFTTSGTTIATLATIDVNNVPASGFLKLLQAILPVGSYTLSSGTTWDGQLIVTEQLQSGGTEYTLYTISCQLDTGLLGFTYEGGNDPGAIYPKSPVAQNLSGNMRYRLKLQRTSGTNNISASPASGGLFQIERTPG